MNTTQPLPLENHVIRILDTLFAALGLVALSPIILILYVMGLRDTGSPLFRQTRVGKDQKPFILLKFRTMEVGTASVGSHMADAAAITKFGGFLRSSKLDELPQLVNVLKGEMSLVGYRPCLENQTQLIQERSSSNVFRSLPGITGLGQIKGVDMSTPRKLAKIDMLMQKHMGLCLYIRLIIATVSGAGRGDKVMTSTH